MLFGIDYARGLLRKLQDKEERKAYLEGYKAADEALKRSYDDGYQKGHEEGYKAGLASIGANGRGDPND